MRRVLHICQMINVSALGIWVGALLMSGAAAAIIFPTMRELRPELALYSGYTGEHWRLAGGVVASRVFFVSDIVQFACAALSAATLAFLAVAQARTGRSLLMSARVLLMGVLMMVFCYGFFIVSPRMSVNLDAYWRAAAAAQTPKADEARARFDADHPTASALMQTTAGLAFVALLLAAWPGRAAQDRAALRQQPSDLSNPNTPSNRADAPTRLEPPALLRSRP